MEDSAYYKLSFGLHECSGARDGAIASLALLNKLPEGRDVWFVSHSLDKYGRPLGVVYLDNRGIVSWDLVDSVNLWMVKEGYAARLDASGKPVP